MAHRYKRTQANINFQRSVLTTLFSYAQREGGVLYDIFDMFNPPQTKGGCLLHTLDKLVVIQWVPWRGRIEFLGDEDISWTWKGKTKTVRLRPTQENRSAGLALLRQFKIPKSRVYSLVLCPVDTVIVRPPELPQLAVISVKDFSKLRWTQTQRVQPLSAQKNLEIYEALEKYGVLNLSEMLIRMREPVLEIPEAYVYPRSIKKVSCPPLQQAAANMNRVATVSTPADVQRVLRTYGFCGTSADPQGVLSKDTVKSAMRPTWKCPLCKAPLRAIPELHKYTCSNQRNCQYEWSLLNPRGYPTPIGWSKE